MSAVRIADDTGAPTESERFDALEATARQIVQMLARYEHRFDSLEGEAKAINRRLTFGDAHFEQVFSVLNHHSTMLTAIACSSRGEVDRGALTGISVILVEDSDFCRDVVQRRLDEVGATVLGVASPDEALRIVNDELKFDVAIVDQRLRGAAGGDAVLRAIAAALPTCGLILTSGLPLDDTTRLVSSFGGRVRLLQKPHGADQLICAVREAHDDARARHDTEPPDTEPAT